MPESGGLGKRILQARLSMAARLGRPVTQGEIAAAMRVSGVSVGRWEKGRKEPDLATIERLAKVLTVDPRWLAFGDQIAVTPEQDAMTREMEEQERAAKRAAKSGKKPGAKKGTRSA